MATTPGSSRFFILAMVELPNPDPIQELADLRKTYRMANSYEFKFHWTRTQMRERILDQLGRLPIKIRSIVVDKTHLPEISALRTKKGDEFIVDCFTRLCLNTMSHPIENDVLTVDAAKGGFLQILRRELSKACIEKKCVKPFKRISGADSKRSDGLQIADMIVGAIKRYAEFNETILLKKIETRIESYVKVTD